MPEIVRVGLTRCMQHCWDDTSTRHAMCKLHLVAMWCSRTLLSYHASMSASHTPKKLSLLDATLSPSDTLTVGAGTVESGGRVLRGGSRQQATTMSSSTDRYTNSSTSMRPDTWA